MSGKLHMGIVNSYDPATSTAEVTSFDGSARYYNVGIMMTSCDMVNGVYSFTPPSINAPCIFTTLNGETLIVGQYAPPNLGVNEGVTSTTGSTMNRSTTEMPNADHLPGDSIITSQSGAEVYLRDKVYAIKMSPIFYSIWNLMNGVWDTMCNIFKFSSPASDVLVDVDAAGNTNITIAARKTMEERGGTPAVMLRIGRDADIISMSINGKDFIHVDGERNVLVSANTFKVACSDIDFTAGKLKIAVGDIDLNAGNVALAVGDVDLSTGNTKIASGNVEFSSSNVSVSSSNVSISQDSSTVVGGSVDFEGCSGVKLP